MESLKFEDVGLECKSAPLVEVASPNRPGHLGISDDRSGHANCYLSPTIPSLRTTPILPMKSTLSEGSKSLVGSLSPPDPSSYRSYRQQPHPEQRLQRPLACSPWNKPRTNSQEHLCMDLDHTRTACDTLPIQLSNRAHVSFSDGNQSEPSFNLPAASISQALSTQSLGRTPGHDNARQKVVRSTRPILCHDWLGQGIGFDSSDFLPDFHQLRPLGRTENGFRGARQVYNLI